MEFVCIVLYFFVAPTFSSIRGVGIGLCIAVVAKLLVLMGGQSIYLVSTVLANEIWSVLGMSINVFDIEIKGKKLQGIVCGIAFMILSVCVYVMDRNAPVVSFLFGLLACTAVILLIAGFEDKFDFMYCWESVSVL